MAVLAFGASKLCVSRASSHSRISRRMTAPACGLSSGVGGIGGGRLKQPRQWLGVQSCGLLLLVWQDTYIGLSRALTVPGCSFLCLSV